VLAENRKTFLSLLDVAHLGIPLRLDRSSRALTLVSLRLARRACREQTSDDDKMKHLSPEIGKVSHHEENRQENFFHSSESEARRGRRKVSLATKIEIDFSHLL
jgi:hypothetical protein